MSAIASRTAGLAVLALTFNAFTWGVSWWPFRRLAEAGLHPLWATTLIYLLAVLAIGLARPAAFATLARTPSLWLIVVASGTTNAAFNWAVTIGDVVRVVLLFYLMPLWALLLARLLLGERLTRLAALRVALALAGAAIVLAPAQGGWPLPRTLADALAVLGGFSFALNNVLLRREAARAEAARALAMFLGGALVAGALAALLSLAGLVPWPSARAGAWLGGAVGLGLWFLAANLCLQYGAARLSAASTAVVLLGEVVFAAVSAWALGAGRMTPGVALGASLIVAASLLALYRPLPKPRARD